MQHVLKITGSICLLYYLFIVLYAGITASFAWFWAALGCLLFAAALVEQSAVRGAVSHRVLMIGRTLFWSFMGAGILVALLLFGKIQSGMRAKLQSDLKYVVVLGAQVRGDTPSKALKARLDKAASVAADLPGTKLILSGGQGPGETISEAECMYRYLKEYYRIADDRLILENRSTSTLENLRFSNELTGCAKEKTGILSNDFHVYRAVSIARKMGYEQSSGIAAPTDPLMQPHFVVREIFALLNEMRRGSV